MNNRDLGRPIFASIIATMLCFIIFDPSTPINYLGLIIIGGTVGWWVITIFEGPTIAGDIIVNEKIWRLTMGSPTGILSLEDNDGDGKITLNDTEVLNQEEDEA